MGFLHQFLGRFRSVATKTKTDPFAVIETRVRAFGKQVADARIVVAQCKSREQILRRDIQAKLDQLDYLEKSHVANATDDPYHSSFKSMRGTCQVDCVRLGKRLEDLEKHREKLERALSDLESQYQVLDERLILEKESFRMASSRVAAWDSSEIRRAFDEMQGSVDRMEARMEALQELNGRG